ncbi:glutathione S-transferase [Bordetella genomosp. 8]|uniref:Glutathione S-transferase n=1 Tax=Bordetella genomosp. 8 TaxID=1416806 RepID=A0A1W6YGL0_9BORD|nr:glutathione transferase [Bordetella genomosp. 8]ARP80255.1 glutathione S-transferase [Bordetella genomosp. 8]
MAVPLTLYVDAQFLSPYALSAYVALEEKGLDFEVRQIDLEQGDQRTAPFLHRSPIGKVPVLAHLDFYLSESSAIAEYLEQAFPPPEYATLYPADPRPRAQARQVQSWLRSDLHALRRDRPTEVVFEGARPAPLSDAGLCDAARLVRVASSLLAQGQAHLFGAWSLADLDLALMLNRLAVPGDELPETLREYAQAQWDHPGVRRWLASRG